MGYWGKIYIQWKAKSLSAQFSESWQIHNLSWMGDFVYDKEMKIEIEYLDID